MLNFMGSFFLKLWPSQEFCFFLKHSIPPTKILWLCHCDFPKRQPTKWYSDKNPRSFPSKTWHIYKLQSHYRDPIKNRKI